MLTFYYARLSVNARRVWIALLEKQVPFEPVLLNLDGDQLAADFAVVNPLQRVPVVVDEGLRVIESLAILDYLEAKYPQPSLMPTEPQAIAVVRMVQMLAVHEIQPATLPLTKALVGLTVDANVIEMAHHRIVKAVEFYEQLLGDSGYFAGDALTLAEVVAGTLVPSLPMFGIAIANYPKLAAWVERLAQRSSWQDTTPTPAEIEAALPNIKQILETRLI